MVKAKHTPKPWTVLDTKDSKLVNGVGRFKIECETNVPGHKGTVALVGYRPNALLIAASPRLLELAIRAEKYIREETEPTYASMSLVTCLQSVIKKAQK